MPELQADTDDILVGFSFLERVHTNLQHGFQAHQQTQRRVHPVEGREEGKQGQRELIACQRIEFPLGPPRRRTMNGLIYLVGLVVVIMFILSFLGLR